MKRKLCLRDDLRKNCPYVDAKVDVEHYVFKRKQSYDYAREHATQICQSIPCLYAIEKLLEKQHVGEIMIKYIE